MMKKKCQRGRGLKMMVFDFNFFITLRYIWNKNRFVKTNSVYGRKNKDIIIVKLQKLVIKY